VQGTRERSDKGRKLYTAEDIQRVQILEDKINELKMVVNGNVEVMSALADYYVQLVAHADWSLPTSSGLNVQMFSKQVKSAIYDLKIQSSRADALARHAKERKLLVSVTIALKLRVILTGHTDNAIRPGANRREHGRPHEEHLQCRHICPEGNHCGSNHYRCDLDLPACNFCFGTCVRFMLCFVLTQIVLLQHRCCDIPESVW
jgi:hypothetical protein